MKKDLRPTYISPSSYAKKQTIPIDVSLDPRLNSLTQNFKIARQNAEYVPIGLNKSISGFLTTIQNSASQYNADNPKTETTTDGSGSTDLSAEAIWNALTLTDPGLGGITDLAANYDYNTGNLIITWTYDTTSGNNKYTTQFAITPVAATTNYTHTFIQTTVNTSAATQTYTLLAKDIDSWFNTPETFSSISVAAYDQYGHSGSASTINNITYVSNLPAPTITVTSINQGYKVAWTDISGTYKNYQEITIEESISDSSTDPGTGYVPVYLAAINPATIITGGLEQRWVRAKFSDKTGRYGTTYSTAYKVTPTAIVSVNTTPANEVTGVTATFSNSGLGDDVLVTISLPTENPGNSFIVKLVPTAATLLAGYFYFFPADTASPKTFTISKSAIYSQFGGYYGSYTGLLISVSAVGNRSNGVSISQFNRTGSLTGVVPTFSISPAANGYTVAWTNVSGATYADIYENSVSWGSGNPTDESLRVYAGQSPVTIQSLNYNTRYIKIRFYDDYGNTSNYSAEQTVTPYNPGLLSLISNPVAFQTEGSILAGELDGSGNPTYPNVIFNTSGIYAYNSLGSPTTQILNTSSGNTFITKQAQIADWVITDNKIENTLTAPGSNSYTGLSGTGTYAFWAGSTSTSSTGPTSDSQSKFWVKKDGSVSASNISITGGSLQIGSNFTVTSAGNLTAIGGDFRGNITASGGSFTGNVQLSGGSLYAGSSPSSGNRTIINSSGIGVFSGSSASTEIVTSPVSASYITPGGNTALAANITLFSTAAQLGGWLVGSSTISAGSGKFTLNSGSDPYIQITGTSTNADKYVRISPPLASTYASGYTTVIEAGSTSGPNFFVESNGVMHANGAIISGTLSSNKTGTSDFTNAGYYFDPSANKALIGGTSTQPNMQLNPDSFYIYSYGNNTSKPMIQVTSNGIGLRGSSNRINGIGTETTSAYSGPSQITLDGTNGVVMYGIPVQGDIDMVQYNTSYMNTPPLGPIPRQRMLVEDPATGQVKLGMAIYMADSYYHSNTPAAGSGYIGDLWVQF